MHSEPETWTVVGRSSDERAAAELALVLEARGIVSRRVYDGAQWLVTVHPGDAAAAGTELISYRRENVPARMPPPPQPIGSGWFGVVSFAAVLLGIGLFVRRLSFGIDWLAVGRMDAGRMLDGEWWRAVTALTLHVDADHLLSNVAFGALFTYFIGRYLGGGIGWMAILAAGALGNLVNGWAQAPDHLAIGASTAVFGALGLLTAHTWRRGFPQGTSFRGRVAPLIAGLGLLAYTGTGGVNTDLGAHLFGFVAGFFIGLAVARVEVPRSPRAQHTAALGAWLLVIGAWSWGISASS